MNQFVPEVPLLATIATTTTKVVATIVGVKTAPMPEVVATAAPAGAVCASKEDAASVTAAATKNLWSFIQ